MFAAIRPRLPAGLLAIVLAVATLQLPQAVADDGAWQAQPYQLGQGLYFPQQRLRIGGYSSVHLYDIDSQPRTLSVQDLSLFVTKHVGNRWKLFSEMEIGDALTITEDETTTKNADFDVERLYADYHATPLATLRFGKFLTPVGQWNLIHADPLVWTVTRPLTSSAAFSRHATGAMMYGVVPLAGNDMDYWLFVDNSDALDPVEKEEKAFATDGSADTVHNNFEHASGLRLQYHLLDDRLTFGASYLAYALQEPKQDYRLAGLDFSWSGQYFDVSGEAIYRKADNDTVPDEHGAFIQAVVPLHGHVYLVGRHEQYKSAFLSERATINTIGFNYRPQPALAYKLEYRSGSHNDEVAPDGWLAAFAVLF